MPLPRLKRSKRNEKRDKKRSTQSTLQRIEVLEGAWCEDGDLLHLPSWRTLRYKETDSDIIVLAELITEPTEPCLCGASVSAFQKWGLAPLAYLHDLPHRDKRVRLYYQKQRYRCTKCERTFLQPMVGTDEQRRLTPRLNAYIKREGLNLFRTFADLGDEVGYSEQTIRDIVSGHAAELEKARQIETPLWISIDEVHIEGQERCVITNPEGKKVIHMLATNSQMELATWLLHFPDRHRIRLVTIDMWAPYLGAVRLVLPKAIIVVDRYHVHNLLSSGIKDVLRVVRESLSYSEHRETMRDPKILLTSRYHLEEDVDEDEEKDA
jgi:transposase